jgi:hypothetical protein
VRRLNPEVFSSTTFNLSSDKDEQENEDEKVVPNPRQLPEPHSSPTLQNNTLKELEARIGRIEKTVGAILSALDKSGI